MTSANVVQWAAVSRAMDAAAAPAAAGSGPAADVFASLMNAGYSPQQQTQLPTDTGRATDSGGSAPVDVYERYQYRDAEITAAEEPQLADQITESEDVLVEFADQAVTAVADKLGAAEEDVISAMETLGLTAYDLMQPQNLVQLAVELTGAQEPAELLTEPELVTLMQDVSGMGAELMEKLELSMDQMDALVAQLDGMQEAQKPVNMQTESPQSVPAEQPEASVQMEAPMQMEVPTEPTQTERPQTGPAVSVTVEENAQQKEAEAIPPVQAAEQEPEEEPVSILREPAEQTEAFGSAQTEDTGEEPADDFLSQEGRQETRQPVISQPMAAVQEPEVIVNEPLTEEAPYVSVDALDIIDQIAEQVRVNISQEETSMELQLNPEHLGKVYLQVTAKEGAVNAQMTAANEAVRNALEAQMAELKESLNQAGVKVDAIEVTVASHEFEQNLEQNAEHEKQEGERAEESSHRRSLRLDSLDELTGVMNEEEALAAQIMRDNGNSMDLSA